MLLSGIRNHQVEPINKWEGSRILMSLSLKRKLRYALFRQMWNIGLIHKSVEIVAGLEGSVLQRQALNELLWMPEHRGYFKADPFVTFSQFNDQELLVFYERFDWQTNIGRIDCVPVTGGRFGEPVLSLNSPYHLSYPYVYCDADHEFYIPEHAEARDVSRYDFNIKGEAIAKKTMLPRTALVDSTLIKHNNRFWIFATHPGPFVNSDLHLYYADDLLGPWHSHKLNPVKSSLNGSRPAGQPFSFKGRIFRPAQNCSNYYGENIVINKITKLSDEEFSEIPETHIYPPSGSQYDYGLHTISHVEGCTVIDGARLESKLHRVFDRLSLFFS